MLDRLAKAAMIGSAFLVGRVEMSRMQNDRARRGEREQHNDATADLFHLGHKYYFL